jgi:hypothetical protein
MDRKTTFKSANIFFNNITIIGAFLYNMRLRFTAELLPLLRLKELVPEEYIYRDAIQAFQSQMKKGYPRTGIKMP